MAVENKKKIMGKDDITLHFSTCHANYEVLFLGYSSNQCCEVAPFL
jgi:hypothetical protein